MNKPVKPSTTITTARSYFPDDDIKYFLKEAELILRSRVSMGKWVEKFQETAAEMHQTQFAFATNSCTSALEVSLLASGVKPGDKVIVPAQTFIATGMAVSNIGAVPVFCDIELNSLCLDPNELEKKASLKVKAVILVHFGGLITPSIYKIQEICKNHGWALIEDAAHAHGAKFDGLPAGKFGDTACFSYYPTKILTTGEGGMIVTDNEKIAKICRSYQYRGQDFDISGEEFALPFGRNIRLPELSALLGVLQYGRLKEFVDKRRKIAAVYDEKLQKETSIFNPIFPEESYHSYWLYTIVLPKGVNRELIKKKCLKEWDINVDWSYYPPLHLMPVFRKLYSTKEGELPVAEDILSRTLCLPIHPLISLEDASKVVDCFLYVYNKVKS